MLWKVGTVDDEGLSTCMQVVCGGAGVECGKGGLEREVEGDMDFNWFKQHEHETGYKIWCLSKPNQFVPWKEWYKRIQTLSNFNYGCEFVEGQCKQVREWKGWGSSGHLQREMGCCRGCVREHGYLDSILPGEAEWYAKRFQPKVGFWRQEGGCVLPRRTRSYTCLMYSCGDCQTPIKVLQGLIQIERS